MTSDSARTTNSVNKGTFSMLKKWAEDMFDIHKEDIREAKKIALTVKHDLQHRTCEKEDDIKTMMKAIQFRKNISAITLIAIFVFFGGWVVQFLAVKNQTENMVDKVDKVETSVQVIKVSTEKNTATFEAHIKEEKKEKEEEEKEQKEENKKQLEAIEKVVKKAMKRR